MSLPEKNSSQEKKNKTLIESFVEEIFNKQELNFVFERFSTICLMFTSSLVHGNACFIVFE